MCNIHRVSVLTFNVIAIISMSACVHMKQMDETDRNLITGEQIEAAHVATAYDVIVKYRANFLHSRGPNSILTKTAKEPTVYLDNVEYGLISSLRNIPAVQIAEIRFIEGWDAMTKYGSDHVAGVIQVYTRSQ
ncbi:MAG TPA: hypothetical protein VM099_11985 [Gemmatimonadaceae bacterium]|nr:hypothetical protein [Gemmatimonadaceae bacterium]